jgi:hypothetical protein
VVAVVAALAAVVVDDDFLDEPHAAAVAVISTQPITAETMGRFTDLSFRTWNLVVRR